MQITINRAPSVAGATIGKLSIDGTFACYTLEDQIREVLGQPVASWKVYGKTAIPAGSYRITLETSNRFGPNTLTVNKVPGFEGVRIHAGNTPADTDGCPLLGMRATESSLIGGTSVPAVFLVKGEVQRAIARGELVTLEINNP